VGPPRVGGSALDAALTPERGELQIFAFGALYTNDNKAELMIVVTVAICRLTQKYAQMQHPLFGIRM
jgi:hypothetical protein